MTESPSITGPKMLRFLTVAALAVFLIGCAEQHKSVAPNQWYASQKSSAPKATKIFVCDTFGCKRRTAVQLTKSDLRKLKHILRRGQASPRAERRAMGKAVQWFERRVAGVVGSHVDKGGWDWEKAGVRGHMDCIDEATNTTSLLLVAHRQGFLRHHRVRHPVSKGFLLDMRYPHATAVVVEKKSDTSYAIDSWVRDNGQAPDIKLLDTWLAERPGGLRLL